MSHFSHQRSLATELITFTWKIKVLFNGLTSIDTSDEWAVARYWVIVGNWTQRCGECSVTEMSSWVVS